ncbi:hypothetical protein L3Q82_018426 [Scortum barcoo]|uniref:Uncharacterized protein n=1 Tax=Scortum barcoo TaxID=214431 RepID=A0ACB8VJA9_9TELE|nr:hypothetical protein L3Q82_018426 [Scortum barcoo]
MTKALMLWTGPPCSPDLNPIEHIWDIMSRSIHQRHVAPQTVQELADALVQVWEEIPQETIRHLIRSMPRHYWELVPENRGLIAEGVTPVDLCTAEFKAKRNLVRQLLLQMSQDSSEIGVLSCKYVALKPPKNRRRPLTLEGNLHLKISHSRGALSSRQGRTKEEGQTGGPPQNESVCRSVPLFTVQTSRAFDEETESADTETPEVRTSCAAHKRKLHLLKVKS